MNFALLVFLGVVHHLHAQVSNPDNKYRKMGIIGTLKIVSTLGDVNAATNFSSSQVGSCVIMNKHPR